MKTTNLLVAALAATLALTSCSKDDPGEPTRDQVTITTTIGGNTDGGTADSRATLAPDGSGSFDASDVLGLYATTATAGVAKLTNSAYTASTKLYWDDLSKTEAVTFTAYYPRTETIADPAAYVFNAATATEKDLLLATPDTKSKGEAVQLSFRHAMHRLIINLTTNVAGLDVAGATIELKNMNASATVNILAGTVTTGEAAEADGTYTAFKKAGATHEYIVAPQKVTTDADWIQIAIDGKQYTYKMPARIENATGTAIDLKELESGKTLTLNLAITRDGVTLTTADIAPWDTQGKIDGELDPDIEAPVVATRPGWTPLVLNPDGTTTPGGDALTVSWRTSGEKIYLYNATRGTSSILTQQPDVVSADGKSAGFALGLPAGTQNGDELYAYYDRGITATDYAMTDPAGHEVSSIMSDGTVADMKHLMYARATYQGEATLNLGFRYLTSALRLKLNMPPGVTITSLQLSGQNVFKTTKFDLTGDEPRIWGNYGTFMDKVTELSLATGGIFYTALFGCGAVLPNGVLVTATDAGGKEYTGTLSVITVEAGNVFTAEVTLAENASAKLQLLATEDVTVTENLTMAVGEYIELKGNRTLTINEGATLTIIGNCGISTYEYPDCHKLTIKGGGTLVLAGERGALLTGDIDLENITVQLKQSNSAQLTPGVMNVNDKATIELISGSTPILINGTLNVNTGGKIEINGFHNGGISLLGGTLHINGGKININGAGTFNPDLYTVALAVSINSSKGKLKISGGGKLTSTIAGGAVFLLGKLESDFLGSKVEGCKGLFKTDTYTLDTDDETEVGLMDATDALRYGVYQWSATDGAFVWTVTQ